jgi:hypothetical protein
MVLPQWGLTSKLQQLCYYETSVLNSTDGFQIPPTAAIPEPLGNHAVGESAQLIPQQVVAEFLPDFAEAEKEQSAKIYLYAVGKILNYKGLDLYICDYDYERPDEEITK